MKDNKNKTYFIETWGCQMNEEDSEKISGMLKNMGYVRTIIREEADVIIFNTCCVRENAEQKVFGNIGAIKALKRKNPKLIIVVSGCMIQQKGMAETIVKKFPFVDILIGTHNSYKFPEYLNRIKNGEKQIIDIWKQEGEIVEGLPIDRLSSVKAFVTIMYGCNNFCTYCIVPYVRGRERSRKPEDIEKEIKELVAKGYKEVTLLGQNVNSYGKGLEPKINFADLLRRIDKIEGLERIKFMTSHPKDLSEEVIDVISKGRALCEQIHLPVQSGSSKMLKNMNRHYTKDQYLDLIKKIKEKIPNASISTDIIVGFPGETEEDFMETLELVKTVEYDSAFTFLYSKRKGTPAFEYENQVDEKTKHDRFNRLVETINSIVIKKNQTFEGRNVEVLVEGISKNDENKLTGRTRDGRLVNFEGNINSIGKLVNVRIIRSQGFSLLGEAICDN
ncbi:tRNA (N6-isopentenyl adenosine(37)-C2)-methylthiotransferase MiaB [Haloimpatiens sp. FM7315]|uniref:tRNA (N6-isopentenyl adenosine(37)-C2)-methylthiotransferase MiaB n=1 Tax=Haloimpatiens sp. FM7315 TaxID=3298609 RepID=UPI0035A38751